MSTSTARTGKPLLRCATFSPLENIPTNELARLSLKPRCGSTGDINVDMEVDKPLRWGSTGVRWNATKTAMHKLPVELFMQILGYLKPDNHLREDSIATFAPIRQVSSWCLKVIDNSPRLWTRITSDTPQSLYLKALKNSQGLLLDVFLWRGDYHQNSDVPLWQRRPDVPLPGLLPYLDRFATLRLENLTVHGLMMLERLSAPNLRSCSISMARNAYGVSERFLLLDGQNPTAALESLVLDHLPINWSSNTLSNLTTLHVNETRYEPSLAQMRKVLQSCPRLQSLKVLDVRQFSFEAQWAPTPDDQLPIELPLLETCFLRLSSNILCALLKTIRVKDSCRLSFHMLGPCPPSCSLPHLLESCQTQFEHSLSCAEGLQLDVILSRTLQVHIPRREGEEAGLLIQVRELNHAESAFAPMWLAHTLAKINVPFTCKLYLGGSSATPEALLALGKLTQIDELHMDSFLNGVIDCLSSPKSASGRLEHWLFPSLRTLNLEGPLIDESRVLQMLKNRHSLPGRNTVGNLQAPVALEKLRLFHPGPFQSSVRNETAWIMHSLDGLVEWPHNPDEGESALEN